VIDFRGALPFNFPRLPGSTIMLFDDVKIGANYRTLHEGKSVVVEVRDCFWTTHNGKAGHWFDVVVVDPSMPRHAVQFKVQARGLSVWVP